MLRYHFLSWQHCIDEAALELWEISCKLNLQDLGGFDPSSHTHHVHGKRIT